MIEYFEIIKDILKSEEFLKRKEYKHHGEETVYTHSLKVSYLSYLYCKKHNLDYRNAAIGGLLHDFYYEPWQESNDHKPLFKKHGFVHAKEALLNTKTYFPSYVNPMIEDIILRHMFPLNIIPPKYLESYVVTFFDKKVSMNVLKSVRNYPKYLGIKNYSK